jgi:TPP-dependent pyruvate/acetoin dehydrogenase alpha subunit
MGTEIHYTHANVNLEQKAAAYGIAATSVDGMDLNAVLKAAKEAAETIRNTGKPYFLVCNTYRFRAHSMFDAELYRDKKEVETWKHRDPIPAFTDFLQKQKLLSENDLKTVSENAEKVVQQAVEFAETCSLEPVEELAKFTYTEKAN